MKSAIFVISLLLSMALVSTGHAFDAATRLTLLGTLGEPYLIRMDLEQNGANLTGSYIYERAGVVRSGNNRIRLNGSIDATGRFRLTETTGIAGRPEPVKTGEFVGQLTMTRSHGEDLVHLNGNWTRARDGQVLPFTLDQQPRLIEGARLSRKEHTEENKPLNYTLHLDLPSLETFDTRFNKYIDSIIDPLVVQFRKDVAQLRREEVDLRTELPPSALEIDHEVIFAAPNLLSILFTVYTYTGGAHPNTRTLTVNWDPDKSRRLELADLFVSGTGYGQTISSYCRRELAKLSVGDPQWLARGTRFNLANYHSWNPTRAGIWINIDPYQVAAYAQGSFEITVPWSVLRAMIRPNSPKEWRE